MLIIPLQSVPSQVVGVTLNGQNVRVAVYQLATGLFCDVYLGDALLIGGVIAQNINRIVRDLYLGFIGDLLFVDTQGSDDPDYSGLGARWVLCYLTPEEIAAELALV